MGTYRLVLVFFFLLALSSARQAQKDHFKVEGLVINSVTGKPLPRVLVQLSGHYTMTGSEGEFSFDGVPAGRIYITLEKPGYFGPRALPRSGSSTHSFDIGQDTGRIVLKMAPEAVIFGRVTGQDDEPLERANIAVLSFISIDGRQFLMPAHNAVSTDEDGNFRVAALPSGRYYLAVLAGYVTRRVLGAQSSKGPEAYPAVVYYPGAPDLAAATAIDLAPGQKMEARFSLALAPAYKLAGKVVAAGEWNQVSPPMIMDALDQVLLTPEQFDSQSGAFEFRAVPAGTYTVRVGGTDQQNRYSFATRKITVSQNVTDLKFSLHPGANIPVEVRTEFSKPPQRGSCSWADPRGEVRQSDCSDYPAAMVDLISMDSASARFSTQYGPVKDSFAVRAVAPGKYMVRARPTLGGYVQSLRSGDLDLLREMLTVSEEGAVAPIEVVLRDDPGTLKVVVRLQKPGQEATILVLPDGALFSTPNLMGTTVANVSFSSLAPGNYKVFAFDSLDGLNYGNPEVLARYAAKAANVTVTSNGNANVAVDVIHVEE